jgi:hypothetical protein
MSFRHPYITHVKFDFGIFNAITLARHFLHIYCSDFSYSKKILWSNKFSKYDIIFLKIKLTFASYETLDFKSWLHDLLIPILWHIVGLFT